MTTSSSASPGDAIVPIEVLLLMPVTLMLARWPENAPVAQLPDALQQRLADMLEELEKLLGPPAQSFLDAVRGGDGRALAGLVHVDTLLGEALDHLMPRIVQAKVAGDWGRVGHEAGLAVSLAAVTDRNADLATAAYLQAMAHVRAGDLAGAVAPFRRSIAAAVMADDVRLQSAAHDNLGNALRDRGDYDGALVEYDAALAIEADSHNRALVQVNRAVALQWSGEHADAMRILLAQVDVLETVAAPSFERASVLCDAAHATLSCGDPARASSLLDQAESLMEADDLSGRAKLYRLRVRVAAAQRDDAGTDAALEQTWALARANANAQLRPLAAHYARGFEAALAHRLPTERADQLMCALGDKEANGWLQALQGMQVAQQQAFEAGDFALALRIGANSGSTLFEAGQMGPAR
ncbi:MAG: hypothetical protein ABI300_00410, partial [Rhodanobacter sp.]